jgi:hypothetical protein
VLFLLEGDGELGAIIGTIETVALGLEKVLGRLDGFLLATATILVECNVEHL